MNEQLAAIRARRAAAKADCDGLTIKPDQYRRTVVDGDGLWVADCYSPEIAVHIAAAPADIDTLLTHVAALTAERDALAAELASYKRNAAYISSVIDSEGGYVP